MRRTVYCVVTWGREPALYLTKELAISAMRVTYPGRFDRLADNEVIRAWRSLSGHNYWEETRSV